MRRLINRLGNEIKTDHRKAKGNKWRPEEGVYMRLGIIILVLERKDTFSARYVLAPDLKLVPTSIQISCLNLLSGMRWLFLALKFIFFIPCMIIVQIKYLSK